MSARLFAAGLLVAITTQASMAETSHPIPRPGPPEIFPQQVTASDLRAEIDADLAILDTMTAMDEMQRFAAASLAAGRVDAFGAVMVESIDGRWSDLSDAEIALNMIAWLPDTADYLHARIMAGQIAISADALSDIESERLWQGLRARVERVGSNDLMMQLARAQVLTGNHDGAIETVERFHPTDRARLEAFTALMRETGPDASRRSRQALANRISRLTPAGIPAHSRIALAEAYWRGGFQSHALEILSQEPDTILRLRMRMEFLTLMAPEPQTGEGHLPSVFNPPPVPDRAPGE